MPTYFPEPGEPDATWGGEDENNVEWLQRSTLPRAASIRAALNENLSRFDPKHASSLAKKLAADWKSHYFELLVGRWLQETGAEIEHEPLGTNGTRIDYRATYREGSVAVEAVSKRMNLHAVMGKAYFDNSEQRIRYAMRDPGKRRQAEGTTPPAFLAIDGGVLGADVESFDVALLGGTVQHHGFDREIVGFSFRAEGELPSDPSSPWAGVLAFLEPGVFGATDPVLYLSPHYRGSIPFAFLRIRHRMLAPTDYPSRGRSIMKAITFAEPHPDA